MISLSNTSPTNIKCLQINLRHSRAAALNLSQLLLDLDVDVAFIQEPYAVSDPSATVKYVPDSYVQLHSLSADHAYGAAIIVKRVYNPTLFPIAITNCAAGAEITVRNQKFYLFSLYCRPSIRDIQSFLLTLSSTLSHSVARRSILCLDSNALNPLWNSRTLDDKGRTFEEFFRAMGLNIINVELGQLEHQPTNTSFLDITTAGDLLHLSEWKFLDTPSLSDHPFIHFSLLVNNDDSSSLSHHDPKRFPRLSACSADSFMSSLEHELTSFPAIDHNSSPSTTDIDRFISDLTNLLLTCAKASRLPPHPSLVKGKMPWWNEELWALRYRLQRSYQAKCTFPSTENIESYSILKAKYQKRLRERKAESWKELCSNNFNGDLFGALKRITGTSAGHCPPPLIKIDGSPSLDPLLTLKAFSSSFFP